MPNNMGTDIAFGYYNYRKYCSYRRMTLVYQFAHSSLYHLNIISYFPKLYTELLLLMPHHYLNVFHISDQHQ